MGLFGGSKDPEALIYQAMTLMDSRQPKAAISLFKKALKNDLIACDKYKNGKNSASKIQQPALCILAEKDKMTPLKSGQQMANALIRGQVTVIESAGHMLPAEFPNEVNTALRNFLNETDKS